MRVVAVAFLAVLSLAPSGARADEAAPGSPPVPDAGLDGPRVAVPSGRLFFADTAVLGPTGQTNLSWRLLEVQVRRALHPVVEVAGSALFSPGSHGDVGAWAQGKLGVVRTSRLAVAALAGGGISPRTSHKTFAVGGLLVSGCVDGPRCLLFVNATAHLVRQGGYTQPLVLGGGFVLGHGSGLVVEYQRAGELPEPWPESAPATAIYLGGRYRGPRVQVDLGVAAFIPRGSCPEGDPLCDDPEGLPPLPMLAVSGAL